MEELPPVNELEALEGLEPDLLYVFAGGPSKGETVLVALPESGWIVIDSATVPDERKSHKGHIAVALMNKFWRGDGQDAVKWHILSHPHTDHYGAIADVWERERYVPEALGTTCIPDIETLDRWIRSIDADGGRDRLPLPAALLRRIRRDFSHRMRLLHDGDPSIQLCPKGSVTAHVCAPTRELSQTLANENNPKHFLDQNKRRNQLSAVLSLAYGATRVILPGDRENHSATDGWDVVLERHRDHLLPHHVLKVPHHGSRGAMHEGLLSPTESCDGRFWVVTPYASSAIPRSHLSADLRDQAADTDHLMEGVDLMLQHESTVHVTAAPVARKKQRIPECWTVTPAEYRDRVGHLNALPDTDMRGPVITPLDPVWACAFNDRGQCKGRWRGRLALMITRQRTEIPASND